MFKLNSTIPAGDGPISVATADLDGDGKLDLVTANQGSNTVSVLLGTGGGDFAAATDYAVGVTPYSVVIGDRNADGKLDLVVANFAGDAGSVLLGDGSGGFGGAGPLVTGAHPAFAAIGDLNGDGVPDLVTANLNADTVSVRLGNGAGGFGAAVDFAVGAGPRSVTIGDLNGDGRLDLVSPNGAGNTVSLLLGDGAGGFGAATNVAAGTSPASVAIGDFNGDGRADLAVADHGGGVAILLNTGLAIAADAPSHAEGNAGATDFTFTVTRFGSAAGAVSADWAVTGSGGHPADAADFVGGVLPGGTVNFADGETSKTLTVQVAGDATAESTEGFTVTLSNPGGGIDIATAQATAAIANDDDAAPAAFIYDATNFLPLPNSSDPDGYLYDFLTSDSTPTLTITNAAVISNFAWYDMDSGDLLHNAQGLEGSFTPDEPLADGVYGRVITRDGNPDVWMRLIVDTQAPTPVSTTTPAAGTYGVGDHLDVTIKFSEAVTVGGEGAPYLSLNAGRAAHADYLSGSGSDTLTFRYVVTADDQDPDGIAVTGGVALNGGVIRDAAGNDASFTGLNFGPTSGVLVDTPAPGVTSIVRAGATLTSAGGVDYTVTFSRAVTGVDASDFALTAGGTAVGSVTSVTQVNAGSYTVHVGGLAGDGTLRLDLKGSGTGIEDVGHKAIAGGFTSGQTYTLDHTAPAAPALALAAGSNSGDPSDLITSDTTPTLEITANAGSTVLVLDGDALIATLAAGGSFTPSSALAEGVHNLTVVALDAAGAFSQSSAPLALTISAADAPDTTAPTVAIGASATSLGVGSTATLTFTFSEAPVGFAATDIAVTGGAVSNFAVTADPKVFTATFTPAGSGSSATVNVAGTGFTDAAANPGVDAAPLGLTINVAAPPPPPPAPPPPPPDPEPSAAITDGTSGTSGDDVVILGSQANSFNAGAGADTVSGGAGDDVLHGDAGADTVSGGAGADSVYGDDGNDLLTGDEGSDYLRGGNDDDVITGGAAFDDLNGNQGNDTVTGGDDGDWVVGGKDNDSLGGEAGDDIVYGNLGKDTCIGGDGADTVRGGQDDDLVLGGAGNDWLSGDRGSDTLTGGAGADIFHTFAEAGLDVVTDFHAGEGDRVYLLPGTTYTTAQVGADTVISMTGGGEMILQNVQLASLTTGWIFGA